MVGLWKRFTDLNAEGKAQVGAMVAAITYWFVHSGAEWFWQLLAITMLAVAYLAMLVARGTGRRLSRPDGRCG